MRSLKLLTVLILFLCISSQAFSQRRGVRRERRYARRHATVVVRSTYRPAKIVVYHPYWRPAYAYHRRWVYFPRYNFYWDNWRNQYVFWNGTVWLSQPAPPPVAVNVNLDNEKTVELNENDDDTDDVYKSNDAHKTQYKPE